MTEPPQASPPLGGGSQNPPSQPLTLHTSAVRSAIAPGDPPITHAVIRVRAPVNVAARPRLSAVLVLDVSRSMMGEPLAQVLHSARRVAEILEDTDHLGVVTFAGGATTAAPLRPLSEGRADLIEALSKIKCDGGTNISCALTQAALLFPRRAPGERQLALLMSDGEPNAGAISPADLGATARLLKARDVAVSTLGYGKRHHADVLGEIALGGSGRYTFVPDPLLAEGSFIRALGAQLDVVAEHVELLLAPGEGVEIVRVLEAPRTSVGAGGLSVELGDLIAGDERNVVVELRVREPEKAWTLKATLSGRPAGKDRRFERAEALAIPGSATADLVSDPASHAVVSVLVAAEMRTRARTLADAGRYADAEAQLRAAQAICAATPGFSPDDRSALADAYQTLADEIRMMAARPTREVYEIHKRASRDYADFATSGPAPRAGARLSEMSPSSRRLLDRSMVAQVMPRASLHVLTGPRAGLRPSLTRDRFVIGRAKTCDLELPDADVSRQHSLIELSGGAFWLVDMGSTHGPMIEGRRVVRHRLSDGDEFTIGETTIRYEEGEPPVLH